MVDLVCFSFFLFLNRIFETYCSPINRSSAVLALIGFGFSVSLLASICGSVCAGSIEDDVISKEMLNEFQNVTGESNPTISKQFLLSTRVDFQRAVNYYLDSKVF